MQPNRKKYWVQNVIVGILLVMAAMVMSAVFSSCNFHGAWFSFSSGWSWCITNTTFDDLLAIVSLIAMFLSVPLMFVLGESTAIEIASFLTLSATFTILVHILREIFRLIVKPIFRSK